MKLSTRASLPVLSLLVLFTSQCRDKGVDYNYITLFPGKPDVPSSIKNEHDSLLARLHVITLFQDSTGIVATKLLELMEHHFREEEDFVFPPLGLLPALASGEIPEKSVEVIQLTEKLKAQLTHMSMEHQLIKASLEELVHVPAKENHSEIIAFIQDVHKHATIEEEVYFPAAIMVGEYLKLRALQASPVQRSL
ncbi:MAG TPA: hemerythrin domain-containing protein [Cyclobacteriaceae bacterium]|nr:hemerythrin domain-containing protein [Cyclobacteriaceae bacterium]